MPLATSAEADAIIAGVTPRRWQVTWCSVIDAEKYLGHGWEPFAVTSAGHDEPQTRIWLRKRNS